MSPFGLCTADSYSACLSRPPRSPAPVGTPKAEELGAVGLMSSCRYAKSLTSGANEVLFAVARSAVVAVRVSDGGPFELPFHHQQVW